MVSLSMVLSLKYIQRDKTAKKVFNLLVVKKTEIALVGISLLQLFNIIKLWLYSLSRAVPFVLTQSIKWYVLCMFCMLFVKSMFCACL